jgi:hypothetical protein
MSIVILGIDLGKNSCSIVGLDVDGSVVARRRMRRDGVIAFAAKLKPCTWRWKPAAVPITWVGRWQNWATRFG